MHLGRTEYNRRLELSWVERSGVDYGGVHWDRVELSESESSRDYWRGVGKSSIGWSSEVGYGEVE